MNGVDPLYVSEAKALSALASVLTLLALLIAMPASLGVLAFFRDAFCVR